MTDFSGYYEAARTLGLTVDPKEPPELLSLSLVHLRGTVQGRRVHVVRERGRDARAHFEVALRPRMDLGLHVSPTSSRVAALFEGRDIRVGDAAFDAAFAVRADERRRVEALLGERLRRGLLALRNAPFTLRDEVAALDYTVAQSGMEESAAWVVATVEALVLVVRMVEEARREVPPALDVARLVPALQELARSRGMSAALDAPARVSGKIGDVDVWVCSRRRSATSVGLEIGASPPEPFPFRFQIETKATGIRTWFADPDLQLGHAELDAAYDVRSEDAERLRAMIDPTHAEELFDLGRGRRLRLDHEGIFISDDAADFDPATLPHAIERAAAVVSDLGRMDRLGTNKGYR